MRRKRVKKGVGLAICDPGHSFIRPIQINNIKFETLEDVRKQNYYRQSTPTLTRFPSYDEAML